MSVFDNYLYLLNKSNVLCKRKYIFDESFLNCTILYIPL